MTSGAEVGVLRCESLTAGYQGRSVVRDVAIRFPRGSVTAVVGANGCGKSTLLKTLARILRPIAGTVYLGGRDIHRQPTRDVARQLAILPQGAVAPDGLTVRELVAFGRFPHRRGFGGMNRQDTDAVDWALDATSTASLAERTIGTLSGGERQRAWIAMAIAQGTDLLLLDEPTTSLDVGHQIEVLELVRRLHREGGKTIVMVLHDLNHAARYADHVVALAEGGVAAEGAPGEVLSPELLLRVFGVRADVLVHPRTGALLCVPYEATAQSAARGFGVARPEGRM